MRRNQLAVFTAISPAMLAVLALFAAIACLSVGNVLTRFSDVGPTASAFYRLFLAMPMTWAIAAFSMQMPQRKMAVSYETTTWPKLALYGLACGFLLGGEIALLHHAYVHGQVGVAIFLNNFAPLFVVLGAWVFFKERPARHAILCLIFAAPGAFLLSGLNPLQGGFKLGTGSVAALLSAVCYAAFLIVGTQMRRYCSAKTMMSWTNMTACLLLAPVAIFNQELLIAQSWQGWMVLLAMAFMSQVLGMRLYTQAMGNLSSTFVSFFSLSQPILTMALAWWVLNENLSPLQMAGAIIVLLSLAFNALGTKIKRG